MPQNVANLVVNLEFVTAHQVHALKCNRCSTALCAAQRWILATLKSTVNAAAARKMFYIRLDIRVDPKRPNAMRPRFATVQASRAPQMYCVRSDIRVVPLPDLAISKSNVTAPVHCVPSTPCSRLALSVGRPMARATLPSCARATAHNVRSMSKRRPPPSAGMHRVCAMWPRPVTVSRQRVRPTKCVARRSSLYVEMRRAIVTCQSFVMATVSPAQATGSPWE